MAIVCAYQFVLQPNEGQSSQDCLDAVRDEIADWICEIYRAVGLTGVAIPFDGTCLAPHPTHELWSEQRECATHRLATIEWVWPEGEDLSLSWLLACTAACDDRSVQVALLIHLVSRPFLLRPLYIGMKANNPLSFLPALVARLLRLWPGTIGGWPIPTQTRLLRENAIDRFVRETLRDPARVLPVVIVNLDGPVKVRGNGIQAAQDRLVGLAQVAALANTAAVHRLAKLLPNDPSWENCPTRVYWPSLPNEPSGTYPLFDAAEMRAKLKSQSLDQVLLTKFIEFSAARYREGELIHAARLAVDREQAAWRQVASTAERDMDAARAEARHAQEERERLRQECDAARQVIRSLQADLSALRDASQGGAAAGTPSPPGTFDELAAELERAWDDNRRLTAEIEADRRQTAELRAELRIHQENWTLFAASRATDGRVPAPVPPSERAFASVAEALQAGGDDFADVLMIWEDARLSAEASPFRTPGKVYRALEAIAEVGRDYFQAKDGGPPLGPVERAFACRVPFKYTGFESQMTLNLYGAERVFHHDDQSRQMQRHLTLGGGDTNNCLQIYFDFDDASQRVLIGYCGRHLSYYRQRT
ncbi:MAG TPA: hypothetical protein VN688_08230 [Gemmataceae bacterium]|nr:hypothetical protein [Gemmataceae bacterium]